MLTTSYFLLNRLIIVRDTYPYGYTITTAEQFNKPAIYRHTTAAAAAAAVLK